jgi:hypothetical protein
MTGEERDRRDSRALEPELITARKADLAQRSPLLFQFLSIVTLAAGYGFA